MILVVSARHGSTRGSETRRKAPNTFWTTDKTRNRHAGDGLDSRLARAQAARSYRKYGSQYRDRPAADITPFPTMVSPGAKRPPRRETPMVRRPLLFVLLFVGPLSAQPVGDPPAVTAKAWAVAD